MTIPPRISDPKELLPSVRKKLEQWIEALEKEGIEVRVVETYRSPERQQFLLENGITKAKPFRSWHQLRRAWDAYPVINGKVAVEFTEESKSAFLKMGEVAQKMGITWGGCWLSRDYGHFEVRDGMTIEEALTQKELVEVA